MRSCGYEAMRLCGYVGNFTYIIAFAYAFAAAIGFAFNLNSQN